MTETLKRDPQFNLKTGADSDLYITREVTDEGDELGKLILAHGRMSFPQLVRRTGDSLKGTTESLESNELRKGRTKGAPILGSSQSEGGIDYEFSPTTFDDLQEAALRGRWTRWHSDTKSPTNKDSLKFGEGMFCTRALVGDKANFGQRRLVTKYNASGQEDKSVGGDDIGLFPMPKGAIVNELTTGNNDVKYAILKRYGGKVGEDLWQEFLHCAVNQMSLTIPVGAIITGTFNVMGTNDPNLPDTKAMIKALGGDTRARFLDGATTGRAFIKDLPEKSTDTDQYTSREGFLYVNGENIEFATNFDFTLDNGMEQKKAIHVRDAIATVALKLDITGNLKTYLVKGADNSEMLFNLAQSNGDAEILDCVHNNEDNPRDLYVFQIFTAKFTEHGIDGSGADTMEMSLPFSSYGERALRIFKIAMPVPTSVRPRINADGKIDGLYLALNVLVDADDEDSVKEGLTITADVNGTSLVRGVTGRSRSRTAVQMSVVDPQDKDLTNEGCVLIPLDRALEEGETLHIVAEMSGKKIETSIPAPATSSATDENGVKLPVPQPHTPGIRELTVDDIMAVWKSGGEYVGGTGDGLYQGYKTGTPPRVNEIHDVNDIKKYYDIYANGVKLPDAVIEYVDGFDMEKAQEVQADGNLPIQNVLWRLVETGDARYSLPNDGLEKAAPTQFRLPAKVLAAEDIVTLWKNGGVYGEGAALQTGTPPKASEIKRVNDLLKYFKVYAKGEELTNWQGEYVSGFDMDTAKTEGADGHLNVQQVTWRITDTGNEDYLVPDGGLEKTSPVQLMKDD